jgi:hypothetical protein
MNADASRKQSRSNPDKRLPLSGGEPEAPLVQVNRFLIMTSKNTVVEYPKSGNGFGPPRDVTDRERRSLYDQRSCHFPSALYQDAPDVKNYFGAESEPFRAGKRTCADAVFAPATIDEFRQLGEALSPPLQAICVLFYTPPCPSGPFYRRPLPFPEPQSPFQRRRPGRKPPRDTSHHIVYARFSLVMVCRFGAGRDRGGLKNHPLVW